MENNKQDNNQKNKQNKGLFITLVAFAVFGVICLIGFGIFGLVKLTDHIKDKNSNQTVKALELEAPSSSANDSAEGNLTVESVDLNASAEGSDGSSTVESGDLNASAEGSNASSTEGEGSAFSDVSLPEETASTENDDVTLDDGKLRIVFMGDSILDNYRDETGIVYLVGQALDADVLNLAIGGTSASITRDDNRGIENWTATCGAGVAKAICGIIDPNVLRDCTAKTLILEHMDDFKKTDIFIIEYGINDFMSGREMADESDLRNPTTYEGALRQMVEDLQQTYPDAKIVMCQPSYVEFFRDNGEYVGNTYVLNNGPGTEWDYGMKMKNLTGEYGTYFFSFEDNGITMENAAETLEDGVHLSETGRRIYAENLTAFLKKNVIDAEN